MRHRSILSAIVIGCLTSGVAWGGITLPTVEVGCQPSGDLRVAWTGNADEVDVYVELGTTFWQDSSTDPSGELFYPGPGTFLVSIFLMPYEQSLYDGFVECVGAPDLVIEKDDGGATVTPGAALAYTLTVTNVGTEDATSAEIQETVPLDTTFDAGSSSAGWACAPDGGAGSTCTLMLGTVTAGGAALVRTFALTVDDPVPAGVTLIDNTASVSSDLTDLEPADNTASDTTPLIASPELLATKDDTLTADVDGDGFVDPGDTVLYTIVLTNSGDEAAAGLDFSDTPDANTGLVVGSVTTTQGTVTSGNGAGDTIVGVNVGVLVGGGGSVTITYEVVIDDPLAPGVTSVFNQGTFRSSNSLDTPTDDPTTSAVADPTEVPVVRGAPDLVIEKDDGEATVTPGAALAYTLTVTNVGTEDATSAEIQETVPLDTTFDAGSSSAGWACAPDGGAGSTCTLMLGTVTAGGAALVRTFALTVDDPVPAGVTLIDNTASVSSDLTDLEPADNTASDTTPLVASPELLAAKDATLTGDVDGDGVVNPGDTVLYTIVLTNVGDEDASGLIFSDTPDANTGLVVGSVTTTQGTVTSGNGAGDTIVEVNVGILLGGGGSATITYEVVIDDPLAPGVTSVFNQGTVGGANIPDTPTDDPTTSAVADPTAVPVVRGAAPAAIPVLDGLGLGVLVLLLPLLGWWRLRS